MISSGLVSPQADLVMTPHDIHDLVYGDDSDGYAICPDCMLVGRDEADCPRCGATGFVPVDTLTEREKMTIEMWQDEPWEFDSQVSDEVDEEEQDDPDGLIDDE